MEILKTCNLTKVYGKGAAQVEAIKNVNISIEAGEFVAIMGPSGSGKSTLLHTIGGLDKPTSGKVFIDNEEIYQLKEEELSIFRRRNIGFIFQFCDLIPSLTVKENILLPLLLDNKQWDREYFNELVNLLGINEKCNCLPTTLSGGQKQRASIARALMSKPLIILADEPTGNLDTKNSEDVLDLLQLTVKRYHQTLIMITHDQYIAERADRIINIIDGKVISKR